MKRISILIFVFTAATEACVIASMPFTAGRADDEASPIYGVTIPTGYRQWELIAVSHRGPFWDNPAGVGQWPERGMTRLAMEKTGRPPSGRNQVKLIGF